MEIDSSTAQIRWVDELDGEPILVALERLWWCADKIGDQSWPPLNSKACARKKVTANSHDSTMCNAPPSPEQNDRAAGEVDPSPGEDIDAAEDMLTTVADCCSSQGGDSLTGGAPLDAELQTEVYHQEQGTEDDLDEMDGPSPRDLLELRQEYEGLSEINKDGSKDGDKAPTIQGRGQNSPSSSLPRTSGRWAGHLRENRGPLRQLLAEDSCS